MDWEDVKYITIIALVIGSIIGGGVCSTRYYDDRGCQYVCDGNGDENAYRWDAGCWCRDEEGLYNPEDSRDGRSK